MKHLVIGASGLVGSYLCKQIQAHSGQQVIGSYNKTEIKDVDYTTIKMDVTSYKETFNMIKAVEPNVIYIPASLTAVDYCEANPEESLEVNVKAVANIALASEQVNKKCLIVYFSSDYVFGNTEISEVKDIPNPINVYGEHKLLAEHYIATTCKDWFIIRTSHVFGAHPLHKNFASRILQSVKMKENIFVQTNQVDTPTYAGALAQFTLDQVFKVWKRTSKANEVLHFSSGVQMSRYKFAKIILDKVSPIIPGFNQVEVTEKDFTKDNGDRVVAKRPNGGLTGHTASFDGMIADFRSDMEAMKRKGKL